MLAVTDGDGNVLETYTHGADLSGQVGGGAGGIGGILASTQAGGAAHYHYDFNGNVVNVSSSNQTQLAKYTYGPFGEVLLKDGSFDSRYQFSTKELDGSTGLNYYGYRFYSPGLGRWINRDPIGERGGINVYAHVFNDPIRLLDPDGRDAIGIGIGIIGIGISIINMGCEVGTVRSKYLEGSCSRYCRCDEQVLINTGYANGTIQEVCVASPWFLWVTGTWEVVPGARPVMNYCAAESCPSGYDQTGLFFNTSDGTW